MASSRREQRGERKGATSAETQRNGDDGEARPRDGRKNERVPARTRALPLAVPRIQPLEQNRAHRGVREPAERQAPTERDVRAAKRRGWVLFFFRRRRAAVVVRFFWSLAECAQRRLRDDTRHQRHAERAVCPQRDVRIRSGPVERRPGLARARSERDGERGDGERTPAGLRDDVRDEEPFFF